MSDIQPSDKHVPSTQGLGVGGICAACGFTYAAYKGHIIPCPRCEFARMEAIANDCVAMNEKQAINFAACQRELAESERNRAEENAALSHELRTWKEAHPSAINTTERRMTPKQLDALRLLNDAFESHDGRAVDQAIITKTDYRLIYEALAEGTAEDRIAQEILATATERESP